MMLSFSCTYAFSLGFCKEHRKNKSKKHEQDQNIISLIYAWSICSRRKFKSIISTCINLRLPNLLWPRLDIKSVMSCPTLKVDVTKKIYHHIIILIMHCLLKHYKRLSKKYIFTHITPKSLIEFFFF